MPKILMKGVDIEHVYKEGKIVTPVLKGVNLEIAASKMTAIVGKSGSGKSTLLHILGTLDTPTKGEVYFNDKCLTTLRSREKAKFRNAHMGFVYQFHHLLGDFTALENVMLPLLIGNVEKKLSYKRALYLLERVGLSNLKDHYPSELSGGERQRVAIARALVHSPEVILADEPTGNLDEENASIVFKLFKELVRDEGTAVVMVTHDMSLALQCDHIFEIVNGVITDSKRVTAESAQEVAAAAAAAAAASAAAASAAAASEEANANASASALSASSASDAYASVNSASASKLEEKAAVAAPKAGLQIDETNASAISDKEIVNDEVKAVIFDPKAAPLK